MSVPLPSLEELAAVARRSGAKWGAGRWESTSTTMHAVYLMRARQMLVAVGVDVDVAR